MPGTWTFVLLLAAYVTGHAALRLWISPALNIDDAREAVFSQTLAWGYQARQPPLYTWLVWAVVRLGGASVASLTVLKYAVLAVAYLFTWAAARRILSEPTLAPLAAFSLLLLLPIGWFVHDDLTQSVAVLAAAAGTLLALVRLGTTPALRWYIALGLGLGLGTLSKLNYVVFAVALVLAALSLAPYRQRILDRRSAVTLGVAAALILPHALWLRTAVDDLPGLYVRQILAGSAPSFAASVLGGLGGVLRALAYYAAPLGLVFLVVFPEVYRSGPRHRPGHHGGALIGRTLLIGVALLVGGALLGFLGQLKFRWAIPLLFLLPLYAFCRLDRLPVDVVRRRRRRAYASVLLAVEALMVGAIVAQTYVGARFGVPARLNTPYDQVARAVVGDGFHRGTIVTGRGPLAGNLRLAFPGARVASLETSGYVPPLAHTGGECLVIWEEASGEAMPEDLRGWLRSRFDVDGLPALPAGRVTAPYRHTPGRDYRAYYVRLPQGAGQCR
jgi:4-amino-4-deoxy-L-arabinose transferase-like glycosyltransferase